MEWNKNDSNILKDFYGKKWKELLSGENPSPELYSTFNIYQYLRSYTNSNINDPVYTGSRENANIIGGDVNLFGDLSFFDTNVIKDTSKDDHILDFESTSKNVYSNVSVYPEDNLYDLRLKIHLLTKIPIYRQFLFYFLNDQGPYYAYQISINKIPYTIRWNDILQKYDININGIYIDLYFEQNKHAIDVISYDKVTLLQTKSKLHINKVYVIDLQEILKEYSISRITDKYQFDLLYYGFIVKFWPQLTIDAFKTLLNDPEKLTTLYPTLSIDFNTLYQNQMMEQDIINRIHKYTDTYEYDMAITSSNIMVYPKMIKLNINIRNIFDKLELNNNLNALFMNIKYGIRNQYFITKKHASMINHDFDIRTPKNTIAISIQGIQQIILTLSINGKYEISTQWLEDDKINFTNTRN